MQDKTPVYVIAGPTAGGKSAYALELADKHNGVIINADSMQVYNRLPILTAQPSVDDFTNYQHELYSVLDPNTACSAGNWREMVEPLIQSVIEEGKTPIIVGGSGLYVKSLTDGLSPVPDIPEDVRQAVVEKQEKLGNPAFHAELEKLDPVMAERFHPYHTARLVRAYEVLEATGQSLAEWQKIPPLMPPEHWEFHVLLVMPERETLYDRCNRRFDWMIENGAMEEVQAFVDDIRAGDIDETSLLMKALGLKPLIAYLNDELSLDDAKERAQTDTRQYAKRQVTWFKHQIKKDNKNIAKIETIT